MSDYRLIPLYGKHGAGKFAKVSNQDFVSLSKIRWHGHLSITGTLYAGSRLGLMHQLILPLKEGLSPDHKNGDTLDNQRSNLRIATHTQNMQNRVIHKNNKCGYKGVYFDSNTRGSKKWRVQLTANGRVYRLGRYFTPEEAAEIYDIAAKELHGEFAKTNF